MIATACVLVAALLTAAPAAADAVRWSHLDGRDSGKLASGPSSWSAESNLKRTSDLTPESWWGNDSSWNRYAYVRNNPLIFIDPDGRLQRKNNGELKEQTLGTGTATHKGSPGREYKVRVVNLFADDGTPIQASSVRPKGSDRSPGDILDAASGKKLARDTGPSNPMATNCHGTTFADGRFAIDNSQAAAILQGDGYSPVTGDVALGDVAIYREAGDIVHSARVESVNQDGTAATVTGLGGLETTTRSLPVGPGQGAAWTNPNATVEYWRQSGAK